MMIEVVKEFHLSVLGCSNVGKTSLMQRLIGVPFNRKSSSKPSLEEEATKYCVEVNTSAGLILFNFYDWGWEQKRKDENINQQLMRGFDGALFVFDVTDRRSKGDFPEHSDWYQRAAGFDKPWLLISNKNDQKKKAVQDGEGQALARAGHRRDFVAISLVDDSGIDDMMLMLSKLMMQDVNLSMTSGFRAASAATIAWSDDRAAQKTSLIGLCLSVSKSKRVLVVSLNSAVVGKFTESLADTEFEVEAASSAEECENEIIAAASSSSGLPIVAIAAPPTASSSQQTALLQVAQKHSISFIVSVPRNLLDGLKRG